MGRVNILTVNIYTSSTILGTSVHLHVYVAVQSGFGRILMQKKPQRLGSRASDNEEKNAISTADLCAQQSLALTINYAQTNKQTKNIHLAAVLRMETLY